MTVFQLNSSETKLMNEGRLKTCVLGNYPMHALSDFDAGIPYFAMPWVKHYLNKVLEKQVGIAMPIGEYRQN